MRRQAMMGLGLGMLMLSVSAQAEGIRVEGAWARAMPPTAEAGGGFVTIHNDTEAAVRLVNAHNARVDHMEIHTMSMDGGVMKMRRLPDGIEIPAHGKVELKPGGEHLMFIKPNPILSAGETVEVELEFSTGERQSVSFEVKERPPVAAQ
ncbi:MAG: copper chaperone PCu(A)C [Lysobacteraceae bacterium]